MITALDSRVMDANSEALGIGVDVLMDNAGKALAGFLSERFPGKHLMIYCGHGNNGGDGFAAACYLPKDLVSVCILESPEKIRSPIVRRYYESLECPVYTFGQEPSDHEVIVDSVLGTGITGELRPLHRRYTDHVNNSGKTIVSVDVPTGIGLEGAVVPDMTLTMHEAKEGMNVENCGEIIIADIGMPSEAYSFIGPGDFLRYPIPSKDSHKGSNGRLLVIGGGPYCGAPAMAGIAAMRTGVDLVTVATPESSFLQVSMQSPVLVMHRLSGERLSKEHIPELLEMSGRNDAVLIGPGLGRHPETVEAVKEFIKKYNGPLVIDADAITALGADFTSTCRETVLTPHAREFMSLGEETVVSEKADRMGCTILKKGREDIVSDGIHTRTNRSGCVGMTSAGTGDVLAGIVGGLLSKGMSAFDAACLGAYISGLAGESAFEERSYGMIATDIIDNIPKILKKHLR
ncbi:MAG: NAD(P)H-hydrate dehydratase [archaeon]|nr:NAD(P)H-hydrate dehydratase [archaeon]